MKTTVKLFIAALLALPTTVRAQDCDVQRVFDKIVNTNGVVSSDRRTLERDDQATSSNGDLMEATIIQDIRVGRSNFRLFHELEEAFSKGNFPVTPTTVYTCFNPLEGSSRQQWSILTKRGTDIRIGQHPNSSYAIVVLPDPANSQFRTVYAAEWWDTDDQNIRQGVLVRSYGEKPRMSSQSSITMTYPSIEDFRRQFNLPDSIPMRFGNGRVIDGRGILIPDIQFDGAPLPDTHSMLLQQLQQMQRLPMADTIAVAPQNIPVGPDGMDGWMTRAMNSVSHLSNADWHRFFGLLTERMISIANRIDKSGHEDKVVAAGIILDLCKNANQLDDDEREVSARRLEDIADRHFHGDRNQYIYDLLMLGAKKLKKD